jgi:gas vesicle protein
MKRLLVGLLLVGVVGSAVAIYFAGSRTEPPEQVVLNSIEYLRSADFEGLENCYTRAAWKHFSLFTEDFGSEQESALRNSMSEATVRIRQVVQSGDTAQVSVEIQRPREDPIRQQLHLVKNAQGEWRID